MRRTQPIESAETTRGVEETHPAFGVAVVSRRSSTGTSLFQSDVLHDHTIVLEVKRAARDRDLGRDSVHGEEQLIEIELSLSQWGALISSVGLGSGVPVTIRSTETERSLPGIPFAPRIAVSLAETRGAVTRLLTGLRGTFSELTAAIDEKQGVKAVREAMRRHSSQLNNAEANAEFAATSLARAAEVVTSHAKADIEAHLLTASQVTGLASPIQVPSFAPTGHHASQHIES